MLNDLPLLFEGKCYLFVEQFRSRELERGRVLRPSEAESLIWRLMADPALRARLRRLHAELTHSPLCPQLTDGSVLRDLQRSVSDAGRLSGLVIVDISEGGRADARVAGGTEHVREAQRIDGLLAPLGQADLTHRGHSYRLLRSGTRDRGRDNGY